METSTQLKDLKGEIDDITRKIDAKEKTLETAEGDKASDLRTSIAVLYSDRSVLIADRSRLLAAPVPAPGKNAPSRPPR